MLKWLMEYKKINLLLGKADSMPLYKFLLALAPRVSSFFYWILDTFIVMGKIKALPNLDVKWVTYRWALFWNFTNLMNIINAIVELVEISK